MSTRARILDTTLSCLSEYGYAATTTVLVCERSNTSRGSLLHQFPTRADLMAAAVEHLFAGLTAFYSETFAKLAKKTDRIDTAIDLLRELYQDRRLPAVLELYVAARTDRALRASLAPVAVRHRANVLQLAVDSFPEVADSPRFAKRLLLALDALQGFAVRSMIQQDSDPETVATLKELLAETLSPIREPRAGVQT